MITNIHTFQFFTYNKKKSRHHYDFFLSFSTIFRFDTPENTILKLPLNHSICSTHFSFLFESFFTFLLSIGSICKIFSFKFVMYSLFFITNWFFSFTLIHNLLMTFSNISTITSFNTSTFFLRAQNGFLYLLSKGHNYLGRDRNLCRIFLRERNHGRTHASVVVSGDHCFLQMSPSHPVFLNGRYIYITSDAAIVTIALKVGDTITIFNDVFELVTIEATESDLEDTDIE